MTYQYDVEFILKDGSARMSDYTVNANTRQTADAFIDRQITEWMDTSHLSPENEIRKIRIDKVRELILI